MIFIPKCREVTNISVYVCHSDLFIAYICTCRVAGGKIWKLPFCFASALSVKDYYLSVQGR